MATLGEFASLLQLGFGVGIGLSLFRAPMNLRANALHRSIEAEVAAVRGVGTPVANTRMGRLASLQLRFNDARRGLDRLHVPFMVGALTVAALNLAALIGASLHADFELTPTHEGGLLVISVLAYVLLGLLLELTARFWFRGVRSELRSITGQ